MKVMIIEPNRPPYVQDIENSLKAMQDIVGGYIQVVPFNHLVIVCNEEGLINGMEYNRSVGGYDLFGTFFICDTDGEEFKELEDKDIVLLKYGKVLKDN